MAVEERERRQLQEALVQRLGAEPADTLMAYLPPVGWADVATKHDLVTLQTVLHADMTVLEERLHGEIAGLQNWVHGELRTQFYWTITLFIVLLGAYTAALKLI